MNIIVNTDTCVQCMLCVRDCVSAVWDVKEDRPVPLHIDRCNLCSHCISICPTNSISHSGLEPANIHKINRNLVDSKVFEEIILSRRSVRNYTDQPVDRHLLEQIIELARYAPTASNMQNVEYCVVTDKSLIQKISHRVFSFGTTISTTLSYSGISTALKKLENFAGLRSLTRYLDSMDYYQRETKLGRDFILHNAPVLILLHVPGSANFGCDNCNIAATTLINYAHTLGLGSCFIGFLTLTLKYDKTMRGWLRIPKKHRVYASLVLGYPEYKYTNTVSRKPAQVTWIE